GEGDLNNVARPGALSIQAACRLDALNFPCLGIKKRHPWHTRRAATGLDLDGHLAEVSTSKGMVVTKGRGRLDGGSEVITIECRDFFDIVQTSDIARFQAGG